MIEYIGLSSLLILAVMVLRALVGGRISQRVRYGLWLLVALRLLVPFQVGTSALSLVPVLQEIRGMWSGPAAGMLSDNGAGVLSAVKENVQSGTSGGGNGQPGASGGENRQSGTTGGEGSPLSVAKGKTDQQDMLDEKSVQQRMTSEESEQYLETDGKDGQVSVMARKAGKTAFGLHQPGTTGNSSGWLWFFLWLSGIVLAGGCFLWANLRFWIRLKKERVRLPDVPGYLPIYGASCVQTPCLYGLFRPAIYLSADMAETVLTWERSCLDIPAWDVPGADRQGSTVPDARLAHILAHEQTHYIHRDHLWAFVRCLCLTLHWYNPLVWAAANLSRRDSELACDEGAVCRLGEANRKAYGATLIQVAAGEMRTARRAVCFTCLWNGKKEMEKRLHILVRRPRTTAGTAVLAAILMVLFAGCAFSNPATIGSNSNGNNGQPEGVSLTEDDKNAEEDDGASGQDPSGQEADGQDAVDSDGEGNSRDAENPVDSGGEGNSQGAGGTEAGTNGTGGLPADGAEGSSAGKAGETGSDVSAEPSGMPDDGEIYLFDEPIEGKVCIAVNPVNMHPSTGRYFHIPHQEGWRSEWEMSTGYGPENAYFYYYVPEDSVQAELQQMAAKLDVTKVIPDNRKYGGRETGCSLWYEGNKWDIYDNGTLYCYQTDDETLEFTEALEQNAALCDRVAELLKEKLDYEPVNPSEMEAITSATMVYTERRGGKESVPQGQTVTDPEALRQIRNLIRQARYLPGGSGCSFYEAVLTVTLASGEEIRMAIASDSCAVFLVNGVYYDYQPKGNSGQLFQYFDRISVNDGLDRETDSEKASNGDETAVKPGLYVVERKGHSYDGDPYVELNEDGTCSFFHSYLDSYWFMGTYEVDEEENTVTLKDDRYTYVFKYSDGELIFDAKRSSELILYGGGVISVADGEVFRLQDKPKNHSLS